jgi:hypothetical protein
MATLTFPAVGDEVRIHFTGSVRGLVQRVTYIGEVTDGCHGFEGIGVLAGTRHTATVVNGSWVLGNGRILTAVVAVSA